MAPVVSDFIADVMGVDGDRIYVSFSFTEPADGKFPVLFRLCGEMLNVARFS